METQPEIWIVLNTGYTGMQLGDDSHYWSTEQEAKDAAKQIAYEHGWPPMFVMAHRLTLKNEV